MKKLLTLLALLFLCTTLSHAQDPKMKKIFTGKNFKGWVVPDSNVWWSADKGILFVKSTAAKKGSILWTKKSYENRKQQEENDQIAEQKSTRARRVEGKNRN